MMVLDGTFYTTYEKRGELLGLVPQKLKNKWLALDIFWLIRPFSSTDCLLNELVSFSSASNLFFNFCGTRPSNPALFL